MRKLTTTCKIIGLSLVLTLVGCGESQYDACMRIEKDKALEAWNSTELMLLYEEYAACLLYTSDAADE